jgi:hypothetical protein
MPFPYVPQTWTDGVSSASAARFGVIEDGIRLAGIVGTSSTPPGSPVDGMIWRLPADATNGIYWWFMYDSSQTTYKWVAMPSTPLMHEILTDEATSATHTVYQDLTTVGPTITVPRSGDYLADFGAQLYNVNATTGAVAALKRGGSATSDSDAIFMLSTGASQYSSPARSIRLNALTASDVVKMQYKAGGAFTAHAARRWLKIRPIRVI